MAMPGQLKTKIDLLKKKMAAQVASLPPDRQRRLHRRLKRLQRARRTATALEKSRARVKDKAAAAAATAPVPPPSA